MSGRGRLAAGVSVLAAALVLMACGDDEQKRFDDGKIVELLNLEKTGGVYAIDGDPFCEVQKNLLNDAEEVGQAEDRDDLGLVIASAGGNAGVRAVPPFAPDCSAKAKKQLKKLDPRPKEEG